MKNGLGWDGEPNGGPSYYQIPADRSRRMNWLGRKRPSRPIGKQCRATCAAIRSGFGFGSKDFRRSCTQVYIQRKFLEKKESQQRAEQKLGRIVHVGQLFNVFCHRLYAFIGNQKVVSSEIKSIPMFLHLIKQKRDWGGRIVFDQL